MSKTIKDQPNIENFRDFLEQGIGLKKVERISNNKYGFRNFSGRERIRIFQYVYENGGVLDFYFGGVRDITLVSKVKIKYF